MKYYIATGLERAKDHNRLRDLLNEAGHEISYDWTLHGSVKDQGYTRISNVAYTELEACTRGADLVIVLLPGGRGTHAELGAAIASGWPEVIIHHPTGDGVFEFGKETCAFYWHPRVTRYTGSLDKLAEVVDIYAKCRRWTGGEPFIKL